LGILINILQYLDAKSFCNVKRSSLIEQLSKASEKKFYIPFQNSFPERKLYLLIERYRREFPRSTFFHDTVPTPIVCACEEGCIDDVKLFVNLYPFHKDITNRDVNGYRDNMTLKEYVNQVGKNSAGDKWTPLMIAAECEHFQIVKFLIELGEADPNIADEYGANALHRAACSNEKDTQLIEFLLTHMSLDSINKKRKGYTPLDWAYASDRNPLRQEIIALIRSKGGKANYYDENGRYVGRGNGDLNDTLSVSFNVSFNVSFK